MEPQVPEPTAERIEVSSPPPPSMQDRPARLWVLALLAATLAGAGAWLLVESTLHHFVPAENLTKSMGMTINVPKFEDRAAAERKNASLANGILGCVLGLALGLAGGLARSSFQAALASGIVGSLLGLAVGVGASEGILPIYFRQLDKASEELSHDIIFPLLIHCGIWSAIGAAGGVALGLGLGSKQRIIAAAFGGLIGGALGTVFYEILGAVAFPASRTTEPIANDWAPRLIGNLAVAMLAATIAVVAVRSPGSKKTPKVEPAGA